MNLAADELAHPASENGLALFGHRLLDSLGIERGGLHAFRHTNSTLMDHLRVPLKVRQQRLGHNDPALTLGVYARRKRGRRTRCGAIGRNPAPQGAQIGERRKKPKLLSRCI
jgi:integrase